MAGAEVKSQYRLVDSFAGCSMAFTVVQSCLKPADKCCSRTVQADCNSQQECDGGLPLATLQLAVVGAVNSGCQGKGILGNAPLDPFRSDHGAKRLSDTWLKGAGSPVSYCLLGLNGSVG